MAAPALTDPLSPPPLGVQAPPPALPPSSLGVDVPPPASAPTPAPIQLPEIPSLPTTTTTTTTLLPSLATPPGPAAPGVASLPTTTAGPRADNATSGNLTHVELGDLITNATTPLVGSNRTDNTNTTSALGEGNATTTTPGLNETVAGPIDTIDNSTLGVMNETQAAVDGNTTAALDSNATVVEGTNATAVPDLNSTVAPDSNSTVAQDSNAMTAANMTVLYVQLRMGVQNYDVHFAQSFAEQCATGVHALLRNDTNCSVTALKITGGAENGNTARRSAVTTTTVNVLLEVRANTLSEINIIRNRIDAAAAEGLLAMALKAAGIQGIVSLALATALGPAGASPSEVAELVEAAPVLFSDLPERESGTLLPLDLFLPRDPRPPAPPTVPPAPPSLPPAPPFVIEPIVVATTEPDGRGGGIPAYATVLALVGICVTAMLAVVAAVLHARRVREPVHAEPSKLPRPPNVPRAPAHIPRPPTKRHLVPQPPNTPRLKGAGGRPVPPRLAALDLGFHALSYATDWERHRVYYRFVLRKLQEAASGVASQESPDPEEGAGDVASAGIADTERSTAELARASGDREATDLLAAQAERHRLELERACLSTAELARAMRDARTDTAQPATLPRSA